MNRRKGGVTPAGGDTEDPLGLDVEGEAGFPEDQLQVSYLSVIHYRIGSLIMADFT